MADNDPVKPLDKLLNEKLEEFESGLDKEQDKELDKMIWDLGHYENEESVQENAEFTEEPPIEEDLVEKKLRAPRKERTSLIETGGPEDQVSDDEDVVGATSLGPDTE